MKESEKENAVKLIKEWQEKRTDFSRQKLSQATGLGYATLIDFDKQGLIKLPKKRPSSANGTAFNNARGMKDWLTKQTQPTMR